MAVSTDVSVLTMTKCLVNGELREAPGSFPVINPSTGTLDRVCTRVSLSACLAASGRG